MNLIAQDLPAFGMDRGRKGELIDLVRALGAIDDLAWIRLMYFYPHKLPRGLVDLFTSEPKLVPYVEMPIASMVHRVLFDGHPAQRGVIELMARGLRAEQDG